MYLQCFLALQLFSCDSQLKELEEEWSKLPPGTPAPSRLTRSQQKKLEEQQAQGIVPSAAEDGAAVDGRFIIAAVSD